MKPSTKKIIIIIAIIAIVLCSSCCCCTGFLYMIGSNSENNEESDSSSTVAVTTELTTEEVTEEETEPPVTTTTTETTVTTTTTTTETTETTTTTAKAPDRSEEFVSKIKKKVSDDVGIGEKVTDVTIADRKVTIFVDISKTDTSIVSYEDTAVSRASSITDDFLELKNYYDMWDEVVVDFGDIGKVTRNKDDIVDGWFGDYFKINSLDGQYYLERGKLESVIVNSIDGESVIVIKAKITPSYNNKATINQNYFNVGDLIKNQGCNKFDKVDYWTIDDMTDGSEAKVVAFTLDKKTIEKIYDESIADIQIGDYADDLFILPSLRD